MNRNLALRALAILVLMIIPATAVFAQEENPTETRTGVATAPLLDFDGAAKPDAMLTIVPAQAVTAVDLPSTWTFAGAVYLHMVGISGQQVVGDATVDLDMSFGDLFDKLQGAFSGHFEGRNGNFGFGVDYVWVKVGEDGIQLGPEGGPRVLPIEGSASMTTSAFELFGTYRFGDQAVGLGALDAILGTRYKSIANTIEITAPPGLRIADPDWSWWDIMFGGRWMRQVGDRGLLIFRADFGSDAYNFQGGVGVNVWRRLDLLVEYKYIKYNRNQGTGANRFVYDASESGPLFGIGVHF